MLGNFVHPTLCRVGECAKRVRRAAHSLTHRHRSEKVNTKWKNREPNRKKKKNSNSKIKRHPCTPFNVVGAHSARIFSITFKHRAACTATTTWKHPTCRIIIIIIIDLLRAHTFILIFFSPFLLFVLRVLLILLLWLLQQLRSWYPNGRIPFLCGAHIGKQTSTHTIARGQTARINHHYDFFFFFYFVVYAAEAMKEWSLQKKKKKIPQKWMAARRRARNPFLLLCTHVPSLRFVRRKECECEWNWKNGVSLARASQFHGHDGTVFNDDDIDGAKQIYRKIEYYVSHYMCFYGCFLDCLCECTMFGWTGDDRRYVDWYGASHFMLANVRFIAQIADDSRNPFIRESFFFFLFLSNRCETVCVSRLINIIQFALFSFFFFLETFRCA